MKDTVGDDADDLGHDAVGGGERVPIAHWVDNRAPTGSSILMESKNSTAK